MAWVDLYDEVSFEAIDDGAAKVAAANLSISRAIKGFAAMTVKATVMAHVNHHNSL